METDKFHKAVTGFFRSVNQKYKADLTHIACKIIKFDKNLLITPESINKINICILYCFLIQWLIFFLILENRM